MLFKLFDRRTSIKRDLFLLGSLVLIFTLGCSSSYQVVKKSTIPLKNYSKVTVMSITADSFWNENSGLKDNEKWVYQVNRASKHIEDKVSNYFKQNWTDNGTKELKVFADLITFNPGSRAARYWVGFGAGKGKIGYHVKLFDGETNDLVSEFDAYGTISMGGLGGDIGVAYDQCANAIIKYIEENR